MKVLKNNATFEVPITAYATGSGNASNVNVRITLPAGLEYVSFDAGGIGSYDNVTKLWTLGALAVPFSYVGTMTVKVTNSCLLDPTEELLLEISFDGTDYPLDNNISYRVFEYVRCCDVIACVDASTKSWYHQVWVDSENGDDTTGALENFRYPYATIQAALTAIAAATNKERWTINVKGYFPGAQGALVLPNLSVLNFENALVENEFTLEEIAGGIDSAYITGTIRTEGSAEVFYTELDGKVIFRDIVVINDGSAKAFDGTAVTIYFINTTVNTNASNTPLVEAGETLKRITALN